jgi:hypothetical protein
MGKLSSYRVENTSQKQSKAESTSTESSTFAHRTFARPLRKLSIFTVLISLDFLVLWAIFSLGYGESYGRKRRREEIRGKCLSKLWEEETKGRDKRKM